MKILAVSDLRVQPLDALADLIEQAKPDLVLYAGDDVIRLGGVPDCLHVNLAAAMLEKQLASVAEGEPTAWADEVIQIGCKEDPPDHPTRGALVHVAVGCEVRLLRLRRRPVPREPVRGTEEPVLCVPPEGQPYHLRFFDGSWWAGWVSRGPRHPTRLHQALGRVRHGLAGVLGNDCRLAHRVVFRQTGFHDLHAHPLVLGDVAFLGLQGAPKEGGMGYVLRSEEATRRHLDLQLRQAAGKATILVSHTPPCGVLDLAARFGVERIGCRVTRESLDAGRFAGVICGHVHRCGGLWRDVEGVPVVNVASHDHPGAPLEYALIEVGDRGFQSISMHTLEFDRDNPLSIPGISEGRAERLGHAGLTTVGQIAEASPEVLMQHLGRKTGASVHRQAIALHTGKPHLNIAARPIPLPLLYLDTEYSSFPGDDPWLVGLLPPGQEAVEQFVEPDPARQGRLIEWLDAMLAEHPDALLATWTMADRRVLLKACARVGISPPDWLDLEVCWLDLCAAMRESAVLPVRSHKLVDIASWFGFSWSEPEYDGLVVGMLYAAHRDRGSDLPVEAIKAYNADDVRAMARIVEGLVRLQEQARARPPPSPQR